METPERMDWQIESSVRKDYAYVDIIYVDIRKERFLKPFSLGAICYEGISMAFLYESKLYPDPIHKFQGKGAPVNPPWSS